MKNENASALAKSRWDKVSPEERSRIAGERSREYWASQTQEQKKTHMDRARGAKVPKSAKKSQ